MRLFIRGAWRSFDDGQRNRPDCSANVKVHESAGHVRDDSIQSALKHPEKSQIRSARPLVTISTDDLPRLKAFYGMFGDGYPFAEDEDHCSIWLDDSRYLAIRKEKHGGCKESAEKKPEVTNLPVGSIEKAASLYLQMKAKGILPTRTVVHGNRLLMHFTDPDGNTVIFNTLLSNGVAASHDDIEIDPEVLQQVLEPRSREAEGAVVQDVKGWTKPEPMIIE